MVVEEGARFLEGINNISLATCIVHAISPLSMNFDIFVCMLSGVFGHALQLWQLAKLCLISLPVYFTY